MSTLVSSAPPLEMRCGVEPGQQMLLPRQRSCWLPCHNGECANDRVRDLVDLLLLEGLLEGEQTVTSVRIRQSTRGPYALAFR